MPPGIGYGRDIPLASEGGRQGGPNRALDPQQSVRLLSLRIPDQPAANAIAPLPLLTSPGSMGAGAAGMEGMGSILENLASIFTPQGPANQVVPPPPLPPSAPQAPAPSAQFPAPPIPPSNIVPMLPPRPPSGGGLGRGEQPQVPTFQPPQREEPRSPLPPLSFESEEVQRFLRNNPGDTDRMERALGRPVMPRVIVQPRPFPPSIDFGEGENPEILPLF